MGLVAEINESKADFSEYANAELNISLYLLLYRSIKRDS